LKQKDETIDQLKYSNNIYHSENNDYKDNLVDKEMNIKQLREKESSLSEEVKTLSDKLTLLKEVNISSQNSHDSTIQSLKNEHHQHLKAKENSLKEDFLKNLNLVNDAVVGKHKYLAEAYHSLVDAVSELQNDLDTITRESSKQSEYLQAHHND